MRRVLFEIHGLRVYSYPALLYVGLVVGIAVGYAMAARAGLAPAAFYAATFVLLVPALSGARLLHVLVNWSEYRRAPRRILRFEEGGASLYGGLLLAFVVSAPVLRWLDVAFWSYWDVASFTLLIGMAFTKIGCFLNGCCAGRPTSGRWAITSTDHRGVTCPRIPAQLLESLLALVLFTGVLLAWSRRPFAGMIFLGMVLTYGLGRVGLELTRDTVDVVAGIRSNVVISAGLVIATAGTLLVLAVR